MPHAFETNGAAIYRQSFATIRREADLAPFTTDEEPVVVRMIHAAYAVLSDPAQRRAYDERLTIEAQAADAELQSQLDVAAITGFTRVQQVPATLLATIPELAA